MKTRLLAVLLLVHPLWNGCVATQVDHGPLRNPVIEGQSPQWEPFALYLQTAIGRVQMQWERELVGSRVAPPVGVTVTVAFWISADGKVSRIEQVKSEPDGAGTKACVSAITRRGTFDPWTAAMKNLLSSEEKLTFTFHYQK